MKVSIIVAADDNAAIGNNNKLLWNLPDDMTFFKGKTMGHTVIMGRKTFESIPEKFRPLAGRKNIVVTSKEPIDGQIYTSVKSLDEALKLADERGETEAFIIGGGQVYKDAINLADKIYLTHVVAELEGDTYFPEIDPKEWKITSMIPHPKDDRHQYAFEMIELERDTVYYFAYGSNMDMNEIIKYAHIVEPPMKGSLEHFVIDFNKQSYKDPAIGFANIVPQWDGVTEGIVYRIRKSDLERLDKKEGYPDHYQKIKLTVDCLGENDMEYSVSCIAYVANYWRQKKGLIVSKEYMEKIFRGAKLLSEEYRELLSKKMKLNG